MMNADPAKRRLVRWGVQAVGLGVAGWVCFWVVRAFAVERNRAVFAARPEVENWANPAAGMDEFAAIITVIVMMILAGVLIAAEWNRHRGTV